MQISPTLEIPFQWGLYLVMTIANVIAGMWLTGPTISWAIKRFVREAAPVVAKPTSDGESLQSVIDAAEVKLKAAIGAIRPFGREVGMIERQLYLYALLANLSALFSGVLLFKAFFAWIDVKQEKPSDEERYMSLARYYGYAIANFLSVLWSLLIFEVVKLVLVTYKMWPPPNPLFQ